MRAKIEFIFLAIIVIMIWYGIRHGLECLGRIEDTVNKTSIRVESIDKALNDPNETTINFEYVWE